MREPAALWNRALTGLGLKSKKKSSHTAKPQRMRMFEPLEQRQLLSVVSWTGLGSNSNWSTAANWSTNLAPVAGDQLIFSGSTRTATVNNLTAGTSFKSIEFASYNFSITGNSLTLTSGIIVDSGVSGSSISAGLGLNGACTVNVVNTSITISSAVSGSGSLTKTGGGTLILTGTNAYSGGTTISAGALQIGAGGTAGSIVGNISNNGQLIVNRSGVLTLSGNIGGNGSLTKLGSGTLELLGTNYYYGGTTINAGTVKQENDSALGYGNLTMGAGVLDMNGHDANVTRLNGDSNGSIANSLVSSTATLNVYEGGNFQGAVTDDLGGSMALHYSGSSSLLLGGYSNYWGGTTIDGGAVTLGSSWGLGYGNVMLNGGILDLSGNDLCVSGLSGSSAAMVTSYWGNATLNIWNGGDFEGTIADGYGGIVSLYSSGNLKLGNYNYYTGGTTISAGTVTIGTEISLGYGNLTMGGGTLDLAGHSAFVYALNGSSSSVITNNGAAATFNISSGGSFAGRIANGTGVLGIFASNSLTLSGNNAYTGGTTINYGTATLGSDSALGDGALTLYSGTVNLNDHNLTVRSLNGDYPSLITNSLGSSALNVTVGGTFAGQINDGQGVISLMTSGSLILSYHNSYSGGTTIASGSLQIGAGGRGGSVSGPILNNGQLIINHDYISFMNSAISGTGSLTKAGSGALYLTGENTYSGGTTISGGMLTLGSGGSTGSIVGNVVNNGQFCFDRADDVTFNGIISGSGSLTKFDSGTLILTGANTYTGGTTIYSGVMQLGAGGSTGSIVGNIVDNGQLVFYRSSALTLSGVISGSGGVTQKGTGAITLSGANSYAGGTTISAGTLRLGNNFGVGAGAVNIASGGSLDLNGYSPTINGLNGSGRVNNTSASVACTLTSAGNGVFSGIIRKNMSVSKNISLLVASGTLNLSGTTTLTGTTNVTGGNLELSGGAFTCSGGTTIEANGTLRLSGGAVSGSIIDNGTVEFSNSKQVTLADAISGTGILRKVGPGETILSGSNTFSGGMYLTAGLMTLGSAAALGTGSLTIDSDARLDLGGFSNSLQPLTTVTLIDGDIVNGSLAANSSFDVRSGAILANLVGAAGLTKSGSGDVTLTGANAYLGPTSALDGVLYVGSSQALPAGTVVTGPGVVVYTQDLYWNGGNGGWNASNAWHYSNGQLTSWVDGCNAYFTGGGTITISGIINVASMQFASGDYSISRGQINVSSYCRANCETGTTIISSAIAGDGLLEKHGEGELKFVGSSSFTGVAWSTNGTMNLDFASMPTTTPGLWLDGDGVIVGPGAIQLYDSYIYDALRTRFDDKTITRNEMIEILSTVANQDSVISASELSDLQAIADNAKLLNMADYVYSLLNYVANGNAANSLYQGAALGNLAAGDDASKLTLLTNKWFLGSDRPYTETGGYQLVSGSLFVNEPTWKDMGQGSVGDCWLISGLGALADASTDCIRDMFIDNGDGTWTVRFYYKSGTLSAPVFTAEYVTVDKYLPIYDNTTYAIYGTSVYQGWNSDYAKEIPGYPSVSGDNLYNNSSNELWLALAEKAYAQWCETGHASRTTKTVDYTGLSTSRNDYASLNAGQNSEVFEAVIGRSCWTSVTGSTIAGALNSGSAVGKGRLRDSSEANLLKYNLIDSHGYPIVDYTYDSTTDTYNLILKNPWGYYQPTPIPSAEFDVIFIINASNTTPADATLAAASELTYASCDATPPSATASVFASFPLGVSSNPGEVRLNTRSQTPSYSPTASTTVRPWFASASSQERINDAAVRTDAVVSLFDESSATFSSTENYSSPENLSDRLAAVAMPTTTASYDASEDFDALRRHRLNKMANHFGEAVDAVLAEEEDVLVLL